MVKRLYNKKSKDELIEDLDSESFKRITCLFYIYKLIENPQDYRDDIYTYLNALDILGRVYVSPEGINAQVSVPDYNVEKFKHEIKNFDGLKNVSIKKAISDGVSFYKLVVKVKKEVVAYGLSDDRYDIDKVGQYLNSEEFNKAIEEDNTAVIDMRNFYETVQKCRDSPGREVQRIITRGKKNVKWQRRSSGVTLLHGWNQM